MKLDDKIPPGEDGPDEGADSSTYWRYFWDREITPWDLGEAHPELRRRSEELRGNGRAFVPGSGLGHDALFLVGLGWAVTAVDFASPPAGLEVALRSGGGELIQGDVFEVSGAEPFDLWFDHTFFCAIPPELRSKWGQTAARLLRPGGRLEALVFPVGKDPKEGGPPFGVNVEVMSEALGDSFRLDLNEEVIDRIPDRGRAESWARWTRL